MDFSRKIGVSNDEVIQRLLVEIDHDTLALLVTNYLDESATQRILKNMSFRAAEKLIEDRARFMSALEKYESLLDSLIAAHSGHKVERAILFTDLVSSTEKTIYLGDDTYYERVLLPHNRIIESRIAEFRGTTIKTIGDSYLAIFESCLDAVMSCAAIQADFAAHNAAEAADHEINTRTAVHYGEFSFKAAGNDAIDVYGTAINYAARLLGASEAGRIFVSGDLISGIRKEIETLESILEGERHRDDKMGIAWAGERLEEARNKNSGLRYRSAGLFNYKGFAEEQEAFVLDYATVAVDAQNDSRT